MGRTWSQTLGFSALIGSMNLKSPRPRPQSQATFCLCLDWLFVNVPSFLIGLLGCQSHMDLPCTCGLLARGNLPVATTGGCPNPSTSL